MWPQSKPALCPGSQRSVRSSPRNPGLPLPGPTPGSRPGSRARGHAAPCPLPAVSAPPGRPWPRWRCPADRVVVVQAAAFEGGRGGPASHRVPRRFGIGTRAPPGRLPLACPATASPQQQLFKGVLMVLWASVETRDDWIRENLWAGSFWVVVVIYKVNV